MIWCSRMVWCMIWLLFTLVWCKSVSCKVGRRPVVNLLGSEEEKTWCLRSSTVSWKSQSIIYISNDIQMVNCWGVEFAISEMLRLWLRISATEDDIKIHGVLFWTWVRWDAELLTFRPPSRKGFGIWSFWDLCVCFKATKLLSGWQFWWGQW